MSACFHIDSVTCSNCERYFYGVSDETLRYFRNRKPSAEQVLTKELQDLQWPTAIKRYLCLRPYKMPQR